MTTSLMKMADTGVSKPLSNLERRYLEQLRGQVQLGESVLGELWGVERIAKKKIENALKPLQTQLRALELKASGMKKLSLVPLTWRNAKGLPVLVPFNLKFHGVRVFEAGQIYGCDPNSYGIADEREYFPEKIRQCYSDIKVREPIACKFDGIVPLSTKRKMESVAHLFSSMYIIAEVESWEISLPDIDPLAVGWDGESLWLVDIFDATPAEEAMATFLLPGS